MEQPGYTRQLLVQLNQQRSRGLLCDVVIVVDNALFRAHRNVLAACSGFFRGLVLQDNLITLNPGLVTPSAFGQVLDFIYTGQMSPDHQGSSELLRAASYLQMADLAALCRRKLCGPIKPSSSTSSSSSAASRPLQVGQNGLQREELSEEERGSVSSSAAEIGPETGLDLGLDLTRKSPTGSRTSSRQQSSPNSSGNSSDDTAFYDRSEADERWCPTADPQKPSHKRPPTGSRSGCLEESVRTIKQEVQDQAQGRLQGRAEVREEDLVLQNGLRISEESGSEDDKTAGCVYRQVQPAALYLCIPCGRGFPSSEQLIAHVDSHCAEEPRVKAEEEDEEGRFGKTEDPDSESLPSLSEEGGPKPDASPPRHACSVCGNNYLDLDLLRRHERSHWLNRPFSCDVCGKLFTQRGTMTRHMRSHLGLKPFACEECGMRFTRQYRKMEHMRTHSREKPYECQLCGVKFTQQRSIVSHLKMHTMVS